MRVCAIHRNDTYSLYNASICVHHYNHRNEYRLPPGGNVTVHFSELVVADVITIAKEGFLTLCEVDVLGTRVVFDPEGKFTGITYFSAPIPYFCATRIV